MFVAISPTSHIPGPYSLFLKLQKGHIFWTGCLAPNYLLPRRILCPVSPHRGWKHLEEPISHLSAPPQGLTHTSVKTFVDTPRSTGKHHCLNVIVKGTRDMKGAYCMTANQKMGG